MKRDLLPCPVCGAEPEEGVLGGLHVVYCNDHLFASSRGKTRQEAATNWNTGAWGTTMTKEELEQDPQDEHDI